MEDQNENLSNYSGLSRYDLSRSQFIDLKKKYSDLKRENHNLKKKMAGVSLFHGGTNTSNQS